MIADPKGFNYPCIIHAIFSIISDHLQSLYTWTKKVVIKDEAGNEELQQHIPVDHPFIICYTLYSQSPNTYVPLVSQPRDDTHNR